jgi:hypothetical protein
MEYVITAGRPFQQIEAQTIDALEQGGFLVHRTFSLGSVMAADEGGRLQSPGYTVLMLYRSSPQPHPLGLVTLCERGGQTVLESLLTSYAAGEPQGLSGAQDVEAELAVALSLGGLDFCVHVPGRENCIAPGQMTEETGYGIE